MDLTTKDDPWNPVHIKVYLTESQLEEFYFYTNCNDVSDVRDRGLWMTADKS